MKTKTNHHLKATSVAIAIASLTPAFGQLAGQYGILDLTANGGINPNTGVAWQEGDQYRLAFYSAETRDASSADPAVYNEWVTAQAQMNPALAGSSWTAMISTTTTNVLVNTNTAPADGGLPVFAMDGKTAIARNNEDIWNGWSNPFATDPTGQSGNATLRLASGSTNLDSDGNEVVASQNVHYSPFLNQYGLGDSATVHGINVWTGTDPAGTNHPTQPAGSTPGTPEGSTGTTQWGSSNPNNSGRVWRRGNSPNTTTNLHLYAISDPLTVGTGTPAAPFVLAITAAVEPGTGFDLEWPSKEGKLYRIRSSATLDTAPLTWEIVSEDIASAGETTTLNVTPGESKLFYVVEEYNAP